MSLESTPGGLRTLSAVSFAALLALGSAAGNAGPTGETAWSVQMHVHGSFSEGRGSIETQTLEALATNVDVIWWSDHDWRISFFHHVSRYSFDAWSEPTTANEPWKPLTWKEKVGTKDLVLEAPASYVTAQAALVGGPDVYEGTKALEIRGLRNEPQFDAFRAHFASHRARHKRTLAADVTIRVAIFPVWNDADARAFLDVELSDHLAGGVGPGLAPQRIHYYLDDTGAAPALVGNEYRVPLAYQPGTWNVFDLEVTADAQAGFTAFQPEDCALWGFSVGVESRNGSPAAAYFDSLEILHGIEGDPLLERQEDLLAAEELLNPGVRQHQGLEVSFLHHLNTFTPDAELPDYDALAAASGLQVPSGLLTDSAAYADFVAVSAVDRAQAQGGVASFNHMFGASSGGASMSKEAVLQQLVQTQAFGADLLEVGYRSRGGHDLADHLWVWDQLALQGLRLVGTGVNDSHGGAPGHWATTLNNYVSWIYAPTTERADLIAGLRGGRVFFGDITLFDGTVDLETSHGHRMGQIVVTDETSVDVTLRADGVGSGDLVRVVDAVGAVLTDSASDDSWQTSVSLPLDPVQDTFLRFEIDDPQGTSKVHSNPVHFVRSVGAQGIPASRAAIALGGVVSNSFSGLTLVEASFVPQGAGGELELDVEVERADGEIHLDYSAAGVPTDVVFDLGMSGTWTLWGDQLSITELSGSGRVRIRH